MKEKRKQELDQYLKDHISCAWSMVRALKRDKQERELANLKMLETSLEVIKVLYEELVRLRGKCSINKKPFDYQLKTVLIY